MKQDQDITSTAFMFKELVKMKRRQVSPGVRRRTKSTNFRFQWLYPITHERRYARYISDVMDVYLERSLPIIRNNIQRWTEEQRIDSVRQDEFQTEFERLIEELQRTQYDMFNENGKGAEGYSQESINTTLLLLAAAVSTFNNKQWNKYTDKVTGQPFIAPEPWLEEVLQAWRQTNFTLIRSLTDEYIKRTNLIVSDGVLGGRTWDAIQRDLRKMSKNLSKSKAKLIARDQVGKLNGQLTKRRQQESGLRLYRWSTARDERVRGRPGGKYPNAFPRHWQLEGKICTWDDDTIYADSIQDAINGNWKKRSSIGVFIGIPGQDISCRCTAIPEFPEMIQEVDEELER